MRTLQRLAWTLAASLVTGCAARSGAVTVITDVTVVDVGAGQSRPGRTVVIRGSRIESVAAAGESAPPRGGAVIDGTGKYLMPGLWDMHVHVAGDERALEAMLAFGITGVRDMGGDFTHLAEARRRIEQGQLDGPRLVLAGPILRGPKSPDDASDADSWVVRTPSEARAAVESLSTLGVDFVKVHEDLPREAFLAIAEAARAKGMSFVGHVPAGVSPLEASDAGELSIEHLEWVPDACLTLFHGAPDAACSPPALASLLQGMAANRTWLDPTIGSFRYWAAAQWPQIKDGFRGVAGEIRRAGVPVLAGTDWSPSMESRGAVPGGGLHDELELLVDAGFSSAEALRSSTSNAARFLGLSKTLGSVEVGKTADLLLLDADPLQDIRNTRRIARVIREGRVRQR